MENYICAIKSPFSKYQRFVYVDHKNRVAPGLMEKRGIKEYINRIADINNTNYLFIDCEVELICPLSSRQVKYLKVSDKNTYISFWSVGIFMHTISLYIF